MACALEELIPQGYAKPSKRLAPFFMHQNLHVFGKTEIDQLKKIYFRIFF